MKNKYLAERLISNGRDLTEYNYQITHRVEDSRLYRDMMNYVDLLRSFYNFDDYVKDEIRYTIKRLLKQYKYKDMFSKIRYESMCIAIMIISYSNQHQRFDSDILEYIQIAFKCEGHIEIIKQVSTMYLILLDLYDYPEDYVLHDFIEMPIGKIR